MIECVDIICGCQYGSEGKGLVAGYLSTINHYDWIVSVNSAQAGHTTPVEINGKIEQIVTRHLPAGAITNKKAKIYIGAGAIINPNILLDEINMITNKYGIPILDRLYINGNTTIITEENIQEEKKEKLTRRIGSTAEGVGAALSSRVMRTAITYKDIYPSIIDKMLGTIVVLDSRILKGKILLEGSQGFGLSIFGEDYPFCTSRDTTSAAFLSYAGISPTKIRDIYGIYRTFPIRVGGNSGEMFWELQWKDIEQISGYKSLAEYTTVTKRKRRIGNWDSLLAKKATIINGINKPILTFANYLDKEIENDININNWCEETKNNIRQRGRDINLHWYLISTSKEGGWIEGTKFYN